MSTVLITRVRYGSYQDVLYRVDSNSPITIITSAVYDHLARTGLGRRKEIDKDIRRPRRVHVHIGGSPLIEALILDEDDCKDTATTTPCVLGSDFIRSFASSHVEQTDHGREVRDIDPARVREPGSEVDRQSGLPLLPLLTSVSGPGCRGDTELLEGGAQGRNT